MYINCTTWSTNSGQKLADQAMNRTVFFMVICYKISNLMDVMHRDAISFVICKSDRRVYATI